MVYDYFNWLEEDRILDGWIISQNGFFNSNAVQKEIRQAVQQSSYQKVHLLIDISELELTPINVTLLSTILLPLFVDNTIGWVILYGVDVPIMKILGASMSHSLGMRMRTAPDHESAVQFLAQKVRIRVLP